MRYFSLLVAGLICVPSFVLAGDTPNSTDTNAVQQATAADDETSQTETSQKPPVKFDGETLNFAYEQANGAGSSVKEFIPEGENLEKWTKLAAFWTYPEVNDPQQLATGVLEELKKKNTDAQAHLNETNNADEAVIDFVVWSEDKSFVEFNVWKFRKADGGGVIGEQYSLRDYKNPEAFVKNLKSIRERLVKQMTQDGLQTEE